MNHILRSLVIISGLMALSVFADRAVVVDQQAIIEPDSEWLSYGRDYNEQRYAPFEQINTETVVDLDLAWSFEFSANRVMEATPLVHDGVLYVTTSWSKVFAFDARTGEKLWDYDPEIAKSYIIRACCGPANRGVAIWLGQEVDDLQVFVGTLEGRLVALDADTILVL